MGESGQAPWQRRYGTVEDSRNVRFDLRLGGAAKRHPLELIADLVDTGVLDPAEEYHWVAVRDAIVAIGSDGAVYGCDGDGVPLIVTDETAGGFAAYLGDTGLQALLDVETAVSYDTIMVLNRLVVPVLTDARIVQDALDAIAGGDTAVDGLAMGVGTVDTFADLPTTTSEPSLTTGHIYRVSFDYELDPSGNYIYYDPDETGIPPVSPDSPYSEHAGNWYRIPAIPQQPEGRYDATTMPHRIVYDDEAATLTIQTCPWRERLSGNRITNPAKAWALNGEPIASIEFFAGRLFFISRGHVTSSRRNDFFNLFAFNVNAVGDDDPIDANITISEAGRALRCRAAGGGIAISCESKLIEFSAGALALTNANGRTSEIADFPCLDRKPGAMTSGIVVPDRNGDVHLFQWVGTASDAAGLSYVGLLTAHNTNILEGREPRALYAEGGTVWLVTDEDYALQHDSFFLEGRAEQSAWGRFQPYERAVFFDAWSDHIRVITQSDEGFALHRYHHREVTPDEGLLFVPRMDRLEIIDNGTLSYDPATGRTTVQHTGRSGDLDRSHIFVASSHEFLNAQVINENGDPEFEDDLTEDTDAVYYLGFTWDTELTLSRLWPRLTSENITINGLFVFHDRSTDYRVKWLKQDETQADSEWEMNRTDVTQLDEAMTETFYSQHGIQGDPRQLDVTLFSDTPGQAHWMGVEYELHRGGHGRT